MLLRDAGMNASSSLPDIAPDVARRAVHWWVELNSGTLRDADRHAFERWLAEHPDHVRAWRHIETVSARMHGLADHASAARTALTQRSSRKRRQSLKLLLALFFVGGSAYVVEQRVPWRALNADYRTAVGERRTVTLADGTSIVLDTDSAIDIDFSQHERAIRLVQGAIMIATGHADASQRRFFVDTPSGRLEALGTRFAVRRDAADTRLDVFESAVRIQPADAPENAVVLQAGQRARFDSRHVMTPEALQIDDASWTEGVIVASSMRLDAFLAEVGRYRRGVIRCDRAIADLRLSGTYPLDDTDRILSALANALPVRIDYMTRYWVTVQPARA
jgi:transmembrane sensor